MNPKILLRQIFISTRWNLLVTLILVLISFFLIKDINNQLKGIDLLKKDILNQELILLRSQVLEEESKKGDEYYNKLLTILPSEKELIKLEDNIKDLKGRYSVNLDFRFGSLNSLANEPSSYNYSLILSGSKNEVLDCFKAFQKITPAIRIEQLEFRFLNPDHNKEEIELKALGRVYIR